jgi:thiamine monophosphate synthase
MKLFAITPDNATIDELNARLPELQNRGAAFLYLRLAASSRKIRTLIDAAAVAGIMPIVPYKIYSGDMPGSCGVHYKSSEISLLARRLPAKPRVITASSHSSVDAQRALLAGAHYTYVSPVFASLSKPGDKRELFPRDELQKLATVHGERIVFLGGMTWQRIEQLREDCTGDFSVAGITLFFMSAAGESLS